MASFSIFYKACYQCNIKRLVLDGIVLPFAGGNSSASLAARFNLFTFECVESIDQQPAVAAELTFIYEPIYMAKRCKAVLLLVQEGNTFTADQYRVET